MKKSTILVLLALLFLTQAMAQNQESVFAPYLTPGVKFVNEKVIVSGGDTTSYFYTYELTPPQEIHYYDGDTHEICFRDTLMQWHYYTGESMNLDNDSVICSVYCLEPGDFCAFHNFAFEQVVQEGRNLLVQDGMMEPWRYYDILYSFTYFSEVAEYRFIHAQIDSTIITHDNFFEISPVMVNDQQMRRYAYLGEQGDTLAFIVQGIGFDSYDMGDLLTPFTRRPDPNADYQEWCGLSHVIKDGMIIYKGMRFRPNLSGDVNGDGEVTIADANNVIDVVVMGGNSGHTRVPAADVNGDGEVNIGDINSIIDMILSRNTLRE